ncbi:HIT family protein [Mycoplasma bradburyae]|uniref:HIT family protein n=1 Tax=Mycoplasma bradburyae TaxID=2963128 RepID=A0AAW6HR23_9MOLU|nr:HIT family protein [Mycoplasma bradburyae]MDC4163437.1 HIT family protein [Mycoplasma bradburyae]MDC4181694.1 HIT family protein [Mycoplasma bradburyae]MDC4182811.1 HIT family protein [Mycoplasma bradburyae]MDC4183485.1 HIT family protein [Mycoplasma bradburyae]MDC4183869.1 HIT family protein [Mycoplasma bradburyae]
MTQSNCIFCKIINKEIEANIVCENELAIAFLDAFPVSNGHTLVIPKAHHKDFSSTPNEDMHAVTDLAQEVIKILKKSSLDVYGFNYVSNEGSIAGQEVFHYHLHIIPKYAAKEGFGFKTNKVNILDLKEVMEKIKN